MAKGLTWPLNQLVPHISSTMQTMIQGISDGHTSAMVGCGLGGFGGGAVPPKSSRVRSAGESHSSLRAPDIQEADEARPSR